MSKLKCNVSGEEMDFTEMEICEACCKPYKKEKYGVEVKQVDEDDNESIFTICKTCADTPGDFRA